MYKEKFVLTRDLHSINGKLLIKKNEPFNFDMLEDLGKTNMDNAIIKVKLKETFVYKDIIIAMENQPYCDFCKKLGEAGILKILGDISLPFAVIEEYHFMRIKDDYTYKHSLNTSLLTLCMAIQFFDEKQKIIQVTASSFTHDIGKSRVPSRIIHAQMPLSDVEFELIKEHTIYGAVLCSYYLSGPYSHNAIVALQHHEKSNGNGYPMGTYLKDEDVMFIIVADIFDALISKRPYRNEPYDVRGAIDILCKSVDNGEIDEEKLKMLISLNRKELPPLKKVTYSSVYRGFYPRINYYGVRKGIHST